MRGNHFPVKYNPETAFYFLWLRFFKLAPMSIVLVLLFLLVGFSVATGYLINDHDPGVAEKTLLLTSIHSPDGPDAGAATPKNTSRHFAISLGAYVLRQNFEDEKALADRLGQPFHIVITDKRVTLNRLFLGTYPRKEATAELTKMKKISPDAFLVQNEQSGMASIYGGSFFYRSDAEKQAKLFARHGVIAVRIPTRLTLPLYRACLGDFDTRAQAMEFLRAEGFSGIETSVVPIL